MARPVNTGTQLQLTSLGNILMKNICADESSSADQFANSVVYPHDTI